jgi:hypothetical protein
MVIAEPDLGAELLPLDVLDPLDPHAARIRAAAMATAAAMEMPIRL